MKLIPIPKGSLGDRRARRFTQELAHRAAWDAGTRHMQEAGRTVWSEDDYNAAVAEFNRLMDALEAQ